MHGYGLGSALHVNAEVDSMGGVIEGGVGIGIKTSPLRAAIEKAQTELRLEYDVREERRRELEFLEKGGNPLDFKSGNGASVSVQSTSLMDHSSEHFVISEAKGSFARSASPRGDSVESSGRPGAHAICEPNSADNFVGENEVLEGERKSKHICKRKTINISERSSQINGNIDAKESEDSAIFRPYARRNRSRLNRDGARSSSNDVVQNSGIHGPSLLDQGSLHDAKRLIGDANQKDNVFNLKSATSNSDRIAPIHTSDNQSDVMLDAVQVPETTADVPKSNLPEDELDAIEPKILNDSQHEQYSEVDAQKTSSSPTSREHDQAEGKEPADSEKHGCLPCEALEKVGNGADSAMPNCTSDLIGDANDGQNGNADIIVNGFNDNPSCAEDYRSVDVNNENSFSTNNRIDDANGILVKQTIEPEWENNTVPASKGNHMNEVKAIEPDAPVGENDAVEKNPLHNVSAEKTETRTPSLLDEKKLAIITEVDKDDFAASKVDEVMANVSKDGSNTNTYPDGPHDLPEKHNSAHSDPQACLSSQFKVEDKVHEDSVLEEARVIEAKLKRMAQLFVGSVPPESRTKSHWDFVLQEMAWLANDFAQERLWKMTAAAQICRRVAFNSRLRVEHQQQWNKVVKGVMQFWTSAEQLIKNVADIVTPKNCNYDTIGEYEKDSSKDTNLQNSGRNFYKNTIQGYAFRFLEHNCSHIPSSRAEAPSTPDRINDTAVKENSWDWHLAEESLFYSIPSGAMEAYRMSIESHTSQIERTSSTANEEVDTSMHDAMKEFGHLDNTYVEEEGETSTQCMPRVLKDSKSTKYEKGRKTPMSRSYSERSYELGSDLPYGHHTIGSQENIVLGKRPANSLNVVIIPPKRIRSASRQKVASPFSSGGIGSLHAPAKADASSGDTSSIQDDHNTVHDGSQVLKSMEVESVGDFEKQLSYDCTETSAKLKKKKAKHLDSAYEPGWHQDPANYSEQRENSKKRTESHYVVSNGASGLHGQHAAKKPKLAKQLDNSTDMFPTTGSIPSPAASQMSNMFNTNKIMKIVVGGRDKGRKVKPLKTNVGQPGSGSAWSLFEDQALVVLVHDMGPNWELVSDAINSTLQFKCVYRKPEECKQRHRTLMDKGSNDGAGSAEDSGSSQPYQSTLPGIPKGSARQLFQRLQGPMEEDTLRSHFEKIIMIGKRQLYKRIQHNNQELRQIAPVHNSHFIALSQACPNNLNGGVLTPLDLCDATSSSQDVLPPVYQVSNTSDLTSLNQGPAAASSPASGSNFSLQGSSSLAPGNNLPSPSGPLNHPVRQDGRYGVPRSSLPHDEQQRMQHYSHMLSARNLQQSNPSVSGPLGADQSVSMLPGGNGIGMMAGMSRSMQLSRPGFQGIGSSPMPNSGSALPSSMAGKTTPVSMPQGTGSVQPQALHMVQPGHNPEHQRPMLAPELLMQVTQGNSQGVVAFNRLSAAFANQTTPTGHPQQQLQMSPSHILNNPRHLHLQGHGAESQQAYAMRLAKERQMQQRLLQQQQHQSPQQQQHQSPQQQQQQIAVSSALMPHVQHPPNPASLSTLNDSQIQLQTSQSVSPTPSSPMTPISVQQQQKHNLAHHELSRNPQNGATNQAGKQRQRHASHSQQQLQQFGRQHPQQRQQPQQAKLVKGTGRGNQGMHQNLSVDQSHMNGLLAPQKAQGSVKPEKITNLIPGQGYPGTGLSSNQQSKPSIPSQFSNHTPMQQRVFSGSMPALQKQLQPIHPCLENNSQGQPPSVAPGPALSTTYQALPPSIMASNQQHMNPQASKKQSKKLEPLYGPGLLSSASQLDSSTGNLPPTNPTGSRPVESVGKDDSQNQFSGSLHGKKQQHSPQIQQLASPLPVPPESHRAQERQVEQQQSSVQQFSLQQQSQQKMQQLQSAEGNVGITSTDSKVE